MTEPVADGPRAPRVWKVRAPIDEIATQHQDLHERLVRWGDWNTARRPYSSLSSMQGLYARGGREATPASTAPPPDLPSIAIERAVIRMPKLYRDMLRMLYVQRFSAFTICRTLRIRYEAFPVWTFTARAMVSNLLRRHGN